MAEKAQSIDGLDLDSLFTNITEINLAKSLARKYLKSYDLESQSDFNTLKQLIYLEILNLRLQENLNESYKTNKDIAPNMVKIIHENIREITSIKDKLGISRKNQQETDAFSYLQLLLKRYKMDFKICL